MLGNFVMGEKTLGDDKTNIFVSIVRIIKYNINNYTTKTINLLWNILNYLTKSITLIWNIGNYLAKQLTLK
jgi:hypothetical protein